MKLLRNVVKIEYLLLACILAASFLVRLYKINNPIADWHSWRQADTASVGWFYVRDGIDLLHPRYHDLSSTATGFENPQGWRFVEFPLFNAIHAFLFQSIGSLSFEVWGRLISIGSSIISALIIFLIGRRFINITGGLLAAFFFGLLPYNIYFSRVILPEPLAVATILIALWCFIVWIDRESYWYLLFSSIFFAVALLIKPFTIFYGVAFVYLVFAKFGFWGMIRHLKLWMFFCLSLIPLFVWRAWMNQTPYFIGIPYWEWAFNGDKIRFKPAFWWWIFEQRLGQLILGGWGVVLFALGLVKNSKDTFPLFVHAVAAGQILYVIVIATANVRHDYYQTFLIPAVALVLAQGTLIFWNAKFGIDVLRRLVVVGCIGFMFLFGVYQVKEFYKINHPEIMLAGAAVDRLTPANALVIAPYNGDTAFLYQTRRQGWAFVTLPIDKMIRRLGAQYYVSVNFDEQTSEIMKKYTVVEKKNEYVVVKLQ